MRGEADRVFEAYRTSSDEALQNFDWQKAEALPVSGRCS